MVSLASVDLSGPEENIIRDLMQQFTTVGFATLTNFAGWDEQEHLKMIKALHSLPAEEKRKLLMKHHNPANKNRYRGMAPFMDNDASHKEFFDMGYPWAWTSEE